MGQLLLRKGKEKVGLVFCPIGPTRERPTPAPGVTDNPGVVSRRHIIGPPPSCPSKQSPELEIAVAGYARVGRAAPKVALGKGPDYGLNELGTQIQESVGYAEKVCHGLSTQMIRAVSPSSVFAFPKAERDPRHVMPLLQEKASTNGAIDSPAHGYYHFLSTREHETSFQ